MKKIPEEAKLYNRRHSAEVKVALDVLRQYAIGINALDDGHTWPCQYCLMKDVCLNLFSCCCPAVFEYHRDAITNEITCVRPDSEQETEDEANKDDGEA